MINNKVERNKTYFVFKMNYSMEHNKSTSWPQ